MKRRIAGIVLVGMVCATAAAQVSTTLSPYTQFGLGGLADQSQSFARGMGGLSAGVRDHSQVNVQNPASYSAVDSLTMVFDLGVSGQLTNFEEGGKKVNAKTAGFDYATALFRVLPRVGASLGVIPYTNIGYSYSSAQTMGTGLNSASAGTYLNSNNGSGGFSQAYFGLGWELLKGFSVGANISYLWGKYERTVATSFSDSYVNTLTKTYSASVNSWKLDLGAQWAVNLGKKDRLTLGATAGIGHKLGADVEMNTVTRNSQTGVSYPSTETVANGFSIPFSVGGGFTFVHNNKLTAGADYSLQKWGDLEFPQVSESTNSFKMVRGILQDRHKVAVGLDWVPETSMARRGFFKSMHYKAGASYATPYYNIGAYDGPKELTVSAGITMPVVNMWNNRTSLSVSAQWVRAEAKNFITENTFRINIGLTFNERWFAKWKVD